jgi:hypothetical protein
MGLRARCESRPLLVPHVNPVDRFSTPHRVGKPVQRIADDAINALDSYLFKRLDKIFRSGFAHDLSPCFLVVFSS